MYSQGSLVDSRPEQLHSIELLRILAAISVFFYHADALELGYLGVDVFFILSGFLIYRQVLAGKYKSSSHFLQLRIARILPLLLAYIILIIPFVIYFFPPSDFKQFWQSAISSTVLMSNLHYVREGSYFDSTADTDILLHTWSLSLEFQFYILFAILLKFFQSRIREILIFFSIIFTIISFYLSESLVFYLLPFRIVEFLLGISLCTIIYQRSKQNLAMLILIGLVFFVSEVKNIEKVVIIFLTLIFIILTYKDKKYFVRGAVFGKYTYSFYIFHLPVLEIYKVSYDNISIFGCFFLTTILSFLSFLLIENPYRKLVSNYSVGKCIKNVGVIICVLLLLLLAVRNIYTKIHIETDYYAEYYSDKAVKNTNKICQYNIMINTFDDLHTECKSNPSSVGKPSLMLIGDSHADNISAALLEGLSDRFNMYVIWYPGCPLYFDIDIKINQNSFICKSFNEFLKRNLDTVDKLILAYRLPLYMSGGQRYRHSNGQLEQGSAYVMHVPGKQKMSGPEYKIIFANALLTLRSEVDDILVVAALPEFGYDVPATLWWKKRLGEKLMLSEKKVNIDKRNIYLDDLYDAKILMKNEVLDLRKVLCDKEKCKANRENRSIYRDDDHLSMFGENYISRSITKSILSSFE